MLQKALLLLLVVAGVCNCRAQTAKYISGQLFVKIKVDADATRFYNKKEVTPLSKDFQIQSISQPFHLESPELQNTLLVEFGDTLAADELIEEFERLDIVEYAEKVPLYELIYTPNDISGNQWNLQKIQAELAWDLQTGDTSVVIAMVDDAVLLSHEDLAPIIWTNPGEIPGNSIDDDGNGYIDDINGWDVADNDNDPNPVSPTNSTFTHGTHCAGIAAAATDNGVGIASISFNVRLMAVKTASTGNGFLTAPYQGVQYAIAAEADIISMSWGGGAYSQTYQNLFDYAVSQGIACIAAAGNSNTNIPMYPAAYNNVIAVGSTNSSDQKSWFSNYGSWVDVVAPGSSIWSSLAGSNSSYGYLSGTSMACPLVSGLAALMLSKDPYLTPSELESCLKSSCDNIDAQNSSYIGLLGAGRINAYSALMCLKPINSDFTSNYTQVCPGDSVQFTDLSNKNPTIWQWTFAGGSPSSSTMQNPKVQYATAGNYDITLISCNVNGCDTITKTSYIICAAPTAALSGNVTISQGFYANLQLVLTGNPPWTVQYSDGTDTTTITNIPASPYYFSVSPQDTTIYALISVTDNSCIGTVSGSANVNVTVQSSSNDTLCVTLQPGPNVGKDALLHGLASEVNTNYGSLNDYMGTAWTFAGTPGDGRSVLEFDLSFIPNGAVVVSASLSLYANTDPPNGPHSTLNGSNACWLQRITTSWIEDSVTWNTQPITTTQNQVALAQSDSANQNYENIDVAQLVQDIIDESDSGYGFLLRLQTESYYRRMTFASSDHSDSTLWPKLKVCYTTTLQPPPCPIVASEQKISDMQGNFTGILDNSDLFGDGVENIGDLNGDGIEDLAVGAVWDDDGASNAGAVWILFMNNNGTVSSYQKISNTQGGFTGTISSSDLFGRYIINLGDLDGDNVNDIGVGANGDDDGGNNTGAIWILFMNTDGTVKSHQKISATQGNFNGTLNIGDEFGISIGNLGDLDNDGVVDIMVGAHRSDDGGTEHGAVWVLFMNTNGTVKAEQKISDTQGGFLGILSSTDRFGTCIVGVNDLDNDGIEDAAVASPLDDEGGTNRGAVWILFLNTNGTVKGFQKISNTQGNFTGTLADDDSFGLDLAFLNDIDNDGVQDIAVGAWKTDDGGVDKGAVWILNLNTDGTVKSNWKISEISGGFGGTLTTSGMFGNGLAAYGDFFGDGVTDLVVGNRADDDGGADRGAIWIINLQDTCTPPAQPPPCPTVISEQKISDTQGGFTATLDINDRFGTDVAKIGDLNGDGVEDLLIGAFFDDDGGTNRGSVYILFMNSNGTVSSYQKISDTQGGFTGVLDNDEYFGIAVCPLGDLDGDNIEDVAIAADYDDDGGFNHGAIWILFLNTNGTVKSHQKISDTQGNFTATYNGKRFGSGLANIGDMDGDNVTDIAVGMQRDNDGGAEKGAVFILFLNIDGTVKSYQKISDTQGGFTGGLSSADRFGITVTSLGDLDGDAVTDIAVGSMLDDDGGTDRGAIWILFLNANGTVKSYQKISDMQGAFIGMLDNNDRFGIEIDNIGDVNGDGVADIAVGANLDDDGGVDRGAVWILHLNTDGTIKSHDKISSTQGSFNGPLNDFDFFGTGVAGIGDFFGDGVNDIVVTAMRDNDGGTDKGAIWILNLQDTCNLQVTPPNLQCNLIADFAANTVCIGDSTSFTDLSTDSLNNMVLWKWYFGDGDSLIGVQNPQHIYATADTFNVTLIVANDFVPACFDTITKSIYVLDTLTVFASPDDTVCVSDSITLGPLQLICGAPPYSFSWTPVAGLDNDTIANPKASPSSTTTYSVTVTDLLGVISSDSITIYVDTNCCQSYALIGSDTNYCFGDTVFFTNNSIGKSNATYSWDFGTNSTPSSYSGATPPGVAFDTTGVIQIMLILNDSCGTDTSYHTINIYPLPDADAGVDDSLCMGDTVQIGAPAVSEHSYLWIPPSGLSSDTVANPYAFVDSTITYIIIDTDQISGCSNTDTVLITTYSDVSTDAGTDVSVCIGGSVILGGTPTAPSGSGYLWVPAMWLNDSSLANPIANPDSTTTYIVYTSSGNCSGSDTIVVFVNPFPLADAGSDTSVCDGDSIQLNASGGAFYVWSPSAGLNSDSVANPMASPSDTTLYFVTVIDTNGCSNSDSVKVSVIPLPVVNIGNDTTLCDGDSLALDVTGLGDAYLWNDSITLPAMMVISGGMYWVEVTADNCSSSDTIVVASLSAPVVSLGKDTILCEGETIVLNAVYSGASYVWSDNSSDSMLAVSDSGIYWVNVSNTCGTIVDSIVIIFNPIPEEILENEVKLCEPTVQLDAGNEGATFVWSTNETTQLIIATDTGIYLVIITNEYGCSLIDSIDVTQCQNPIFIPNTITPNADGKNDVWKIRSIEFYPGNRVEIYNRNGNLIFEANDYQNDWNGTWNGAKLPATTYYYIIDLNNGELAYKGTVTIIRAK